MAADTVLQAFGEADVLFGVVINKEENISKVISLRV